MPGSGPVGAMHPILEEVPTMGDRAGFADEITLSRLEVFDVVARCDEVVERAGEIGEVGLVGDHQKSRSAITRTRIDLSPWRSS